jgi:hypothetical protein
MSHFGNGSLKLVRPGFNLHIIYIISLSQEDSVAIEAQLVTQTRSGVWYLLLYLIKYCDIH